MRGMTGKTAIIGAFAVAVLVAVTWGAVKFISAEHWDATQWSALATAVTIFQTVGVVVALLYARNQIHLSRELANQDRLNALLDRAVEHFFTEVEPRANSMERTFVSIKAFGEIRERRFQREVSTDAADEMLRRLGTRVEDEVPPLLAAYKAMQVRAAQLGLTMPDATFVIPWFDLGSEPPDADESIRWQRDLHGGLLGPVAQMRERLVALIEDQAPLLN